MKAEEFASRIRAAHERRAQMMAGKGHDYDAEADRLSSFKETAALLSVLRSGGKADWKGSDVAEVLFALKLVRNANLKTSGKDPKNESRMDTLDDAHNYIDLGAALEDEERKNANS